MIMLHTILALLCGGAVGFTLGLIGGGGSILATPLLLYVVGLAPHEAIGTGALAVSASGFANFAGHARAGNVRWGSAVPFAIVGTAGAAVGSSAGKALDGQRLLFLFAMLMIMVGFMMLRHVRPSRGDALALDRPRLAGLLLVLPAAMLVGLLSGFFGIGGGFLIVPGLIFSTGMPMIEAIGSSLLSVGTFGLATAANYAISGLVLWVVALEFIGGGVFGGLIGMALAIKLAKRRAALNRIFAGVVLVVAIYMLYQNIGAIHL